VIWRTAIQSEADVKIELLESCHSPGAAVEDLVGSRVLGIVADILDEQVARQATTSARTSDLILCWLVNQVTVNILWSEQSSLNRRDQGN
jgi:hypothetical protein